MVEIHCQQCGKAFGAKRRSARFCSALCRQHHWRGHPPVEVIVVAGKAHVVDELGATSQASHTFWERMEVFLKDAQLVAVSTQGTVVAASIIVMDDDAEIVREWELDGEP